MSAPKAKYDAIGIGIGPFNLSAAALAAAIPDLRTLFVDRMKSFAWHPGLLISGSTIQTSHLKDLVTLADPTSPYSFLSYLHAKRRMYRFITADFDHVERAEFDDYFRWTAEQLPNVQFGCAVESVDHDGSMFILNEDARYTARSLILGTGLTPSVPECAAPFLGPRVFHGHRLLQESRDWHGKRVAVVGGGQSGAEVFNFALGNESQIPAEVHWISSRSNFLPLDDSPFTNELFTPGYSGFFFDLPVDKRLFSLSSQKLASDGISMNLLRELYRKIYALEFVRKSKPSLVLRPHTKLIGMQRGAHDDYVLELEHGLTGDRNAITADVVLLCTGYHYRVPAFLERLLPRIVYTQTGYQYHEDFSIAWEGHPRNKIYVQNAAINARGIADPNLSLMAWRSANIVNDLVGRPHYAVQDSKDLKIWR
ncbi:lysine N(6)-hydroxylase/L-ornithine N(5)-oxygenase family protein [Sorangium sp. So ce854]|uniref:lysine N(6)-hydroxylase/L-ornithine N(5)-oxygenase family protein n=1 Tax=Sorangium sp. So ce854 TaxID=3133322 RepID=UPI003F5EA93D